MAKENNPRRILLLESYIFPIGLEHKMISFYRLEKIAAANIQHREVMSKYTMSLKIGMCEFK